MDKIDKIRIWLSSAFRILVIIAAIIAIINRSWMNLALSILILIVSFLPAIMEGKLKIDYPSEFDIAVLVFVYASLYLGELHGFYTKLWWWDIFLHGLSGIIIGIIGFSLVYILNREECVTVHITPLFISVFAFSFALSFGALWEIFEFAMDSFLGWNMQKSGLADTMWDLIIDALGALIASIVGYLHLKGNVGILKRFGKEFIENFRE